MIQFDDNAIAFFIEPIQLKSFSACLVNYHFKPGPFDTLDTPQREKIELLRQVSIGD
jgi:hypothetical protein